MASGNTTGTVTLKFDPNNAFVAKEHSIDQFRSDVSNAFEDAHSFDLWIVEIFDTFVIARDTKAKTHWKITFTQSGNDIDFAKNNAWQEVKLNKEWINKSLFLKDRLNFEDFEGEDDEMIKPNNLAIKELGGNRLGFYGMLWGDKVNKDLHGEYFTPETDGLTELFDQLGSLPFTYHHATDPKVKSFVFGELDTMSPDDVGMWCEVQIKRHKQYKQFIQPLVREESLYPSAETLVGAKQAAKSGEILRWVTSFMTGTPSPAEWRLMEHPIDEIKGYFKSSGLEYPDVDGVDGSETDEDSNVTAKGVEETQRIEMLIEIESQKLRLLQLDT